MTATPTTTTTTSSRKLVFVSHAAPADNEFTLWLALRLAREGYEVWCDLTKLLGGTNWWVDIEHAIREKACKFVYVVSKMSNKADGVLKELAVADGVKKALSDSEFIIPIKIDDLPYREHNIYINGLNALDFKKGWAPGLADLLKTLREKSVPREAAMGPATVASWWNDNRLNRELVQDTPQKHLSNWFPIVDLPEGLWVWRVPSGSKLPESVNWPAYCHGNRYVSFASAAELTGINQSPTGGRGMQIALSFDNEPDVDSGLTRSDIKIVVRKLLHQAWEKVAQARKLPLYELSSRRRTLWFPTGSVNASGVSFTGVDGKSISRQLHGFKSVGPKGAKYKRHYHYGLEAEPILYPQIMLALKAHVIFTLDGKTPHRDVAYQHKSRRSQCSMWWNDRWRDLMSAAISSLSAGTNGVQLPLSPNSKTRITSQSVEFSAPKSYRDEDVKEPSEDQVASVEDGDEIESEEEGEEVDDGN